MNLHQFKLQNKEDYYKEKAQVGIFEVFIVGLIGALSGIGTASMVKPIVKRFYGEHLLGKAISYIILLILVVWCC